MHRGDIFVAFIFLGIIWLLAKAMWAACTKRNATSFRDIATLTKQERKRTLLITPDHQDPHIVGDVPHFHQAQYPASRANVRRGEG